MLIGFDRAFILEVLGLKPVTSVEGAGGFGAGATTWVGALLAPAPQVNGAGPGIV